MRTDHCKGCRKTYAAALELFASNNWIAGLLAGLPLYYLGAMMIAYHKAAVATLLSGGSYSFLGALICAWANACLCLWRIWPNGLTVSIFLLKALGYWSFVSFFILLFYGVSRLPLEITTYLCIMIMPEIIMLLLTADVLRAARSRHFKALEAASSSAPTAVATSDVAVHVDQESL